MVEGNDQGSPVRGLGHWSEMKGHWSVVTGQSHGSVDSGQNALVNGHWSNEFQGSKVKSQWSRVMIMSEFRVTDQR